MNNFHVESCASMVRLVRIARFQFSLWRIFRHQHPYSDQILSWQVKVAWHIVPVDRICTVAAQSFDNCWLQHPEGDKTLRIMTVFQAISLPPSMNFLATANYVWIDIAAFHQIAYRCFLQNNHIMSTLASKAWGLQRHEACASEFGILTLCVLQCIFSTRQSLKSIVKFVDRGPFHIHGECAGLVECLLKFQVVPEMF